MSDRAWAERFLSEWARPYFGDDARDAVAAVMRAADAANSAPVAVAVEPSADGLDCDGSGTCASALHQHGCFADQGNCTDPDDHATKPVEPSAAEVEAGARALCDAKYGTGCWDNTRVGSERHGIFLRSATVVLLAARTVAPETDDPWCRREDCRYRHWRSGDVPTHKRGDECPPPETDAGAGL